MDGAHVRLQRDAHTGLRRLHATLDQRGNGPVHRLRLAHARLDEAAQQADDDEGVQPVRDRDMRLRALNGGSPDGRIGIGEGEAFLTPCLARADGGDHQPMRSHCDRFLLCFNGEIYNHTGLRAEI